MAHDAHVRLVRNVDVDIVDGHRIGGERLARILLEDAHGEPEHRAAVHLEGRIALHRAARHVPRGSQDLRVVAVRVQVAREDSGLRRGLEHHGPRAVAEEDARGPVLPVEDAGEDFRADHERAAVLPGAHEKVGGAERIHEAGAHRLHVEGGAAADAELRLQQASARRKHHVRRGCRDDDEVDVRGRAAGGRQRRAARVRREIAGEFVLRRDVALADAGALDDPLVARVHHRLEVAVGDEARGQVAARSRDAREASRRGAHGVAAGGSAALRRAISSAMRSSSPWRTSESARASAVAKARRSAEPWLFTTTPRKPTSAAPL